MLKGSLSFRKLRWLAEELVDVFERLCQKERFDSGGEGCVVQSAHRT